MTSLPAELPARLQDDVHVHAVSAYNLCLDLERSLQQAMDSGQNVGNDIIYIRILGYLIHFVPTYQGLKEVVNEIISARTDRARLDVGKMYFNHYIRAFRATKGRIPTPSNHASRPSFDTVADMLNGTLEDAPQSYSVAKKNALYRDGFRCVVTGKYDTKSFLSIKEIQEKATADLKPKVIMTQCAHIFADSTNQDIELGSEKWDYAAIMWAVMVRFGYTQLPAELNGSNVHRLENVMTVDPSFHMSFDDLKIWFVATNVENKYKLEAVHDYLLNEYPEYVTFNTPDPLKYPVPSAVYLSIHAACARVAHLSGAGACLDKFYRDLDDSTTLDPNGGSAEILAHALSQYQVPAWPIAA